MAESKRVMEQIKDKKEACNSDDADDACCLKRCTSLGALIAWNISKALEKNPVLDVKGALTSAKCRLEQINEAPYTSSMVSESACERHLTCALLAWQQLGHSDAGSLCRKCRLEQINEAPHTSSMVSESACERHLTCALLAWQQLGHSDAGSLCRFFEKKKEEENTKNKLLENTANQDVSSISQISSEIKSNSDYIQAVDSSMYNTSYTITKMGPVVKLPVEKKIVMHVGSGSCPHKAATKPKAPAQNVMKKIDQACCLDTKCIAGLAELDAATKQLRTRVGQLARREAERIELLERADSAWRDLELGYQRRLRLAEEKEDDLARQIAKVINERNKYKDACTALAQDLRVRSEAAESERARLTLVEKNVCERACKRMQLSEQCAKGTTAVAELSCRAAQVDRDLQLKEEQARRKAQSIDSEADAARTLTLEVERAIRAELGALRDQIADVSKDLLEEEAQNEKYKIYLEELRQEKMGMIEDLEGCKVMCDGRMQAKIDQLKKLREKLSTLKEKVLECQCKVPVDASVEVKRTPSLAALCRCTPEQKLLESCSCTSIRSKLLSDLLADLFGGLQSELGASVARMPCQLLKCLEDKHNWDRASIVKNSLRDYFSQLLVGELDIAIANSIENYHAKWVGESCADVAKIKPDPGEVESEGWQQRAVEQRAQKMATKLAEQLFQERADQLTQRAKQLVAKGPPPCECKPPSDTGEKQTGIYPCLVKHRVAPAPSVRPSVGPGVGPGVGRGPTPVYWHHALQRPTKLRSQGDHIKKDSLKKEDLRMMEEKNNKRVQRAPVKVSSAQDRADEDRGTRTMKKSCNKINVLDEDEKINAGLVKQQPADNVEGAPEKQVDWRAALEGVTQLRLQIEELKKDTLKKEDLKVMEKKFAKLIQRASGFTTSNSARIVNTGINMNDLIKKDQKTYRVVNQSGLHVLDNNKPTSTKRNICEITPQIKKNSKPHPLNNRKVEKPSKSYKNIRHTYAVNMCLCSTKQQHNIQNDKYKYDAPKQTDPIDTISQMSGVYKHSNPINTSLLSEDFTTLISSKEFDQQSCLSDCVCFHKKPSNTSIDKLLDTLAKWKYDLDTSIVNRKNIHHNSVNKESQENENLSFRYINSVESQQISQQKPIEGSKNCISAQTSEHHVMEPDKSTQSKTSKKYEKLNCKTDNIRSTESAYIGTINLDKSIENFCNSNNYVKTKTTTFMCSNSSKCGCGKTHEMKALMGNMIDSKETKHPEVNSSLSKQLRPVTDVTVLSVSKSKEKHQSQQLQSAKNITLDDDDIKMTDKVHHCDYEIKCLGVTLVDVNPSSRKFSVVNGDQIKTLIHTNHTTPCMDAQPKLENTEKSDQFKVYIAKQSSSYYQNVNIKHINESNVSLLQNFCKNDQSNRNLNGTSSDLKKNKIEVDRCLLEQSKESESDFLIETNTKKNVYSGSNSRISEVKTNETSDSQQKNIECKRYPHQPLLTPQDLHKTIEKQKVPYECTVNFDESKKISSKKLIQQKEDKDVALDLQSLMDFNTQEKKCVCCNTFNTDYSKELEENAFLMLEEYLRKKLDKIKESSCKSLSIAPGEEEKMFNMILQKVKKLISESTIQIVCENCSEARQSQGSWNRAYGLLQEYIKMKVKKVKCDCVSAQGNRDAILPDVLDKVSKLIEYDFQRLKQLYGCEKNPIEYSEVVNFLAEIPEKDRNNISLKSVDNALTSVHNRLNDVQAHVQSLKRPITSYEPKISRKSPTKMNIKSCDDINSNNSPCSHYDKCYCVEKSSNIKFYHRSLCEQNLLKTDTVCFKFNETLSGNGTDSNQKFNCNNCTTKNDNLQIIKKRVKKSFSGSLYEKVLNTNNSKSIDHVKINNNIVDKAIFLNEKNMDKHIDNEMMVMNESVDHPMACIKHCKEDILKVRSDNSFGYYQLSRPLHAISIRKQNAQYNVIKSSINADYSISRNDAPYIGLTINCSCDNAVRTGICPKIISKTNTDIINDIMKKYMPDETFLNKISYIMKKTQPIKDVNSEDNLLEIEKNVSLHSINKRNTAANISLHECETEISRMDTQIVLKKSRENVDQSNATTNTCADSIGINNNYSAADDTIDWCICPSLYNSGNDIEKDNLKTSIFFPAPVGDFKKCFKDEPILFGAPTKICSKLNRNVCSCETIPICQVKMLIDDIESKLMRASCTCDSMIPKVCPVHNSKCFKF